MNRHVYWLCAISLTATTSLAAPESAQVKRGKYLVDAVGCHDCHTPLKMGPKGPEPDMSRALTGHPEQMVMPPPPKMDPQAPWNWAGAATLTAFAGPWGVSYAVNLTPDDETGIGRWKEKDFVQAIRTGKHLGVGRPINPPMPWHIYRNFNDADLKAIFAYLKSLKPVRNKVPDWQPPAGAAAPKK